MRPRTLKETSQACFQAKRTETPPTPVEKPSATQESFTSNDLFSAGVSATSSNDPFMAALNGLRPSLPKQATCGSGRLESVKEAHPEGELTKAGEDGQALMQQSYGSLFSSAAGVGLKL